jgi:hypothetical protein
MDTLYVLHESKKMKEETKERAMGSGNLYNVDRWTKNLKSRVIRTKIRYVIALMMEIVSTSETSVNLCDTTCHNIPEHSHLQKGRRSLDGMGELR